MSIEKEQNAAWHFWQDQWLDGNPAVMGAMDHGAWLGSTVFDGARAFEGVAPDLDLHCQRLVDSAAAMGLNSLYSAGELLELCREGIGRFPNGTQLYIKPMYWATSGFVAPDAETTQFCLSVFEAPLPSSTGFSVTLSPYRRPTPETAPTNAKAACLYPNSGRAMVEAQGRGFDNAVMLDTVGHVAELATANLWYAKDGVVHTPAPNGTFVNGHPCVEPTELSPGDEIELGEWGATFTVAAPRPRARSRPVPPGTGSPEDRGPYRRKSGVGGLIAFVVVLVGLGAGGWGLLSKEETEEVEVASSDETRPERVESGTARPATDPHAPQREPDDDPWVAQVPLDEVPSPAPEAPRSRSEAVLDRLSPPVDRDPEVDVREIDPPDEGEKEIDDMDLALEWRDAGALARLLTHGEGEPRGSEVRRLLQENTIYSIEWDGRLPTAGSRVLRKALGYTCENGELRELAELGLEIELHELRIQVRSEQKYHTGLGRRIGDFRLAPHPKKVELEIFWLRGEDEKPKRLLKSTVSTPFLAQKDLPDEGLPEEEVWRRTLEPLRTKITQALTRIP